MGFWSTVAGNVYKSGKQFQGQRQAAVHRQDVLKAQAAKASAKSAKAGVKALNAVPQVKYMQPSAVAKQQAVRSIPRIRF